MMEQDFEDHATKVVMELSDCRELVKNLIQADERCRNDDRWLMLKVWEKQGIMIMIDFQRWKAMYSPETIRRVRQEIQSVGESGVGDLLPTDPDVLVLRRVKEEAIRSYYGAKSRILQEFIERRYDVK